MSAAPKTLNIIALTQGSSIDIFLRVLDGINAGGDVKIDKAGALVSFARHVKRSDIVKDYQGDITYIREWEIVKKALHEPYDKADLAAREQSLDPASIWSAIIADRRLIYGKRAKFAHDTRVHFTDEQLWAMAWYFMLAFDALIEEVKPDVIIGFTPVTFGEILGYEIARSKGIPVLHLHSTRIENYFALHDTMLGTSRNVMDLYSKDEFALELIEKARAVLKAAQDDGLMYEGVDLAIAEGRPITPIKSLKPLMGALWHEVKIKADPDMRGDHHDPGAFAPWIYKYWIQPIRERVVKQRLKHHTRFIMPRDLKNIGVYCFFPLHSEPEVALQILGRPYHKNQIELLRNLAASLPAGMKLVVKEHPRSMGLRPYSYYKALLEIPNLYIIDAHAPSMPVVRGSSFVAVVSGTIGFEAIMAGKPVLLLGHPKYESIPGKMTRTAFNLYDLPGDIRTLLDEYAYDPEIIVKFVAALMAGGVPIDLYSNLLKKPGRKSFQDGKVSEDEDLQKLATYTLARIHEVLA